MPKNKECRQRSATREIQVARNGTARDERKHAEGSYHPDRNCEIVNDLQRRIVRLSRPKYDLSGKGAIDVRFE